MCRSRHSTSLTTLVSLRTRSITRRSFARSWSSLFCDHRVRWAYKLWSTNFRHSGMCGPFLSWFSVSTFCGRLHGRLCWFQASHTLPAHAIQPQGHITQPPRTSVASTPQSHSTPQKSASQWPFYLGRTLSQQALPISVPFYGTKLTTVNFHKDGWTMLMPTIISTVTRLRLHGLSPAAWKGISSSGSHGSQDSFSFLHKKQTPPTNTTSNQPTKRWRWPESVTILNADWASHFSR